MTGIKNIIFDLGGVIINLDNRKTEEAFTALGVKNSGNTSVTASLPPSFRTMRSAGSATRNSSGLSADSAAFPGPRTDHHRQLECLLLDFPAERIRLIKELRKTYRLFLFSNTNALHLAALRQIWIDSFAATDRLMITLKKPTIHISWECANPITNHSGSS